jgi:hypothetical protein
MAAVKLWDGWIMEAAIRRDIKLAGLAAAQLTVRFVPANTGPARGALALWGKDFMA